jgi:hypothetical protein
MARSGSLFFTVNSYQIGIYGYQILFTGGRRSMRLIPSLRFPLKWRAGDGVGIWAGCAHEVRQIPENQNS